MCCHYLVQCKLSLWIGWPEYESYCSLSSGVELENEWSFTSCVPCWHSALVKAKLYLYNPFPCLHVLPIPEILAPGVWIYVGL